MRLPRSPRLGLLLVPAVLLACTSTPLRSDAGASTSSGTGTGGSAGTGGGAGTGGSVPVTCTWTKKASNATCPNGPCPIVLDDELTCDDGSLAVSGLRVAAGPEATWLATTSLRDSEVYRLTATGEERQDGLPKGFANTAIALALGPDGTVHVAADTTKLTYVQGHTTYLGGATHATLANGVWSSSLIRTTEGSGNITAVIPVVDLEVGSDGAPRVWIVSSPPSEYSLATPSTSGWSLAAAALPNGATVGTGGWNRFTLGADGSIVSLALTAPSSTYRLHAIVGGADRAVGSPFAVSAPIGYAIAAPTAPTGPLFGVALSDGNGIRVVGESASAPETETVVPGTSPPVPTCPTPSVAACTGTCHETGSGMEYGDFALAWTDDGVAWLAYVVTAFDQTISYAIQQEPGPPLCFGQVIQDSSLGTLHLVRVALDGSAPTEALVMPIDRPGGAARSNLYEPMRVVDARGSGKDLALGVRTGWEVSKHSAVRVLRVDTTKL